MTSTVPTLAACRKRLGLLVLVGGSLLALAGCGGSSSSTTTSTKAGSTSVTTAPASTTAPATGATQPSVSTAVAGANAHSVSASSGGVTASMRAGTHKPKVEAAWPIHFTVTRGGQPAAASVSYEYMFAGQVVAHRSHYTFKGRFSDVFKWPSSAVGYPLTFRAVITAGAVTLNLDYPVQVKT